MSSTNVSPGSRSAVIPEPGQRVAGRTGGWWRSSPSRSRRAPGRAASSGGIALGVGQPARLRIDRVATTTGRRPGRAGRRGSAVRASRTRSRSSRVALRPNVIMSSWSMVAWPSAMYRVASAAIVNVLPVPALASSSVVPEGSPARRSNGSGAPRCGRRRGRHRDPARAARIGSQMRAPGRRTGTARPGTTARPRGPLGEQARQRGGGAPQRHDLGEVALGTELRRPGLRTGRRARSTLTLAPRTRRWA